MLSATPSRREMLVWIVAAIAVVVGFVTMRDQPAGAGAVIGAETQVVYIATGLNFPDALGAGSPAALELAPILLVEQNNIPAATLAELNRLAPKEVVIVGGPSAVSDSVFVAIEGLAFKPIVTRISGNNRYETAAALSQSIFPTTGKYPRIADDARSNADEPQAGVALDLLTQQIVAPDHGFLFISAMVDTNYEATATTFNCWLWVDDNTNTVFGSTMIADVDSTNTEENCATQGVEIVQPGVITVGFRLQSVAAIDTLNASLIVIWIPFGANGFTPEPS